MCEEGLLEEYLETGHISVPSMRNSISNRKIFPCYFGSALRMSGVEGFLDGIVQFTEEPSYPKQFGARIYKITRDPPGNETDAYENHRWNTFCEGNFGSSRCSRSIWGKSESDKDLFRRKISNGARKRKPAQSVLWQGWNTPTQGKALAWKKVRIVSCWSLP